MLESIKRRWRGLESFQRGKRGRFSADLPPINELVSRSRGPRRFAARLNSTAPHAFPSEGRACRRSTKSSSTLVDRHRGLREHFVKRFFFKGSLTEFKAGSMGQKGPMSSSQCVHRHLRSINLHKVCPRCHSPRKRTFGYFATAYCHWYPFQFLNCWINILYFSVFRFVLH